MNFRKLQLLLAMGVLVVAAMAATGSASAAVLCKSAPANQVCPAGDRYEAGSAMTASLKPGTVFVIKSFGVSECSGGVMNFSVTNGGGNGIPVQAKNSLFSLTSCTYPVTTLMPGSLSIDWVPGTHSGKITINGIEIEHKIGSTRCKYGGTISGIDLTGGATGLISASVNVARISGALCSNPGKWTMQFVVPGPLYVTQS